MKTVKIRIDDREMEAQAGESVLDVALRNGIFIPHLCHRPASQEPWAGCRLCFVEVDGRPRPVTSCTERVREGLVVRTDTESVRRLQRSALRLLLSAHHIDCKACVANRRCALQDLARSLGVKLRVRGLRDLSNREPLDRTLGKVVHDPSKCVLCGQCVQCCKEHGQSAFHFAHRGLRTRVVVFPPGCEEEPAGDCWQVCPVGALFKVQGDLPAEEDSAS